MLVGNIDAYNDTWTAVHIIHVDPVDGNDSIIIKHCVRLTRHNKMVFLLQIRDGRCCARPTIRLLRTVIVHEVKEKTNILIQLQTAVFTCN